MTNVTLALPSPKSSLWYSEQGLIRARPEPPCVWRSEVKIQIVSLPQHFQEAIWTLPIIQVVFILLTPLEIMDTYLDIAKQLRERRRAGKEGVSKTVQQEPSET